MKHTVPGEFAGNFEMVSTAEGILVPGRKTYAYHSFQMPEYATAVKTYLTFPRGILCLAMFDSHKLRGSRVRTGGRSSRLLELNVLPEIEGESRSFCFLAPEEWKILVDSVNLQETVAYQLAVWVETVQKVCTLYGFSSDEFREKQVSESMEDGSDGNGISSALVH